MRCCICARDCKAFMTNLRNHEGVNMRRKLIFIVPLAILGMALFIFIGGEIVTHLWNWLLPALFGFRQIGLWQGLGTLVLCRILFGGFGLQGSGRLACPLRSGERLEPMSPG